MLFDLCDTISSRDELETVFWSLTKYSDLLFDESKERKGRAKDKYLDRSGKVTEVFNLLYFYFYKLEGDEVCYDALTKAFDDTVEIFRDNTDAENEDIRKCLNQVVDPIKSCDRKMPFDDYLFALCDSLESDMRETFYEGVLKGSIECLTYEFADLENGYAGLDVDLSPQEKRLAALHQMRRKVQKRYNL